MGASLARFANIALNIQAPKCHFFNIVDWAAAERAFPWLHSCRTLALANWNAPLGDTYPYFISTPSTAEEAFQD
jgi:hypothetical protein